MYKRSQPTHPPRELTPPQNLDAERFVLGCLIIGYADFQHLYELIKISDFSLEKHREIFMAIASLHSLAACIDRLTVAEELRRKNQLNNVGGLSYLVSLDDGLPQTRNIDSYMRIIREKSSLRNIILTADLIQKRALVDMDTSHTLIADFRRRLD